MTTTKHEFPSNIKKWFWTFFLGQAFLSGGLFLISWGSNQATLNTHTDDIKIIKVQMSTKADIQMVLQIKSDIKDNQKQMMEDIKYIRQRLDDWNDHKNNKYQP